MQTVLKIVPKEVLRQKNKQKDLLEGINISKEVKELIEDDTFEYKIPFKDPNDLLMNFTSLEEK